MPTLIDDEAKVAYLPQFLPADVADRLILKLHDELQWRERKIRVFGREVQQPRLTAWHGDARTAYTYSETTWNAEPWTPSLLEIAEYLHSYIGHKFNGVLCNLYRDGHDYIGWHSDNEKELGVEPLIASISLGAVRTFRLKHKHKDRQLAVELEHGSLLTMAGTTQQSWRHCLPKRTRCLLPRINLTFRQVIAQP